MKSFKNYISEVHYSDLFNQRFVEMRKKYMKLRREDPSAAAKMYINFTNHVDNNMDRNPFVDNKLIDHSDPVGIYAYPLNYVINHAADIWYGANAKYMRILAHKYDATKSLYLQSIKEWDAIRMIGKIPQIKEADMHQEDVYRTVWKWLRKHGRNINTPGTVFFFVVQHKIENGAKEHEIYSKKEYYEARTNVEQTQIFLKLGFNSLVDTAKNQRRAIINPREPEQIVFLRRDAFEVVEVIPLNLTKDKIGGVTTFQDPSYNPSERKLAAYIATEIGDKLKEGPERSSLGGWSYYWTQKGRRIEIIFERDQSYYDNKKMGDKKHKEAKLSDPHKYRIRLRSERGTIGVQAAKSVPFQSAAKSVIDEFNQRASDPSFKAGQPDEPETRAKFLKKQEDKHLLDIMSRWFEKFWMHDFNDPESIKNRGYEINNTKDLMKHLVKRYPKHAAEIKKMYNDTKHIYKNR